MLTLVGDIHGKVEKYRDLVAQTKNDTLQLGDFGFGFKSNWMTCDGLVTDIISYNHNLPRYDENWYDDYTSINSDEDDTNHYESIEDYYTKEIEPTKVNQVYSNNTFAIKLNLVIKNYFKSIFK